MKRNFIFKDAGILLVAAVLILSAISVTANTNTNKTIKAQDPVHTAFDTLLSEGFEDGVMPPPGGWSTIDTNTNGNNWGIVDAATYPDFVHSGDYAAWVQYDDYASSDEWLISPDIDLTGYSTVTLVFWIETDTDWPTATIELHIRGAGFDDIIWDCIQNETWSEFIYREKTFDLSNYIGEIINISWRYVGIGGNSVGLDDILVTTDGGEPLIADADGPYEAEEGEPIQFQGSASGGVPPYSFHWDFGNGDTSDEEDPIYTYEEEGVYDVTLTVTDDQQNTDDDLTTATINPKPCCFEVTPKRLNILKLKADVKEICGLNHSGVNWTIEVTGGVFFPASATWNGVISSIPANGVVTINTGLMIGFGSITITITIDDCDPEVFDGKIILFFIIV